jgi:hypothetical protein
MLLESFENNSNTPTILNQLEQNLGNSDEHDMKRNEENTHKRKVVVKKERLS